MRRRERQPGPEPRAAEAGCRDGALRLLCLVGQPSYTPLIAENPRSSPLETLRRDALTVVRAGLAGVEPSVLVGRALAGAAGKALETFEYYDLCAAGKASVGMLDGFRAWAGPRVRDIVVADGAHPVPDDRSVRAARDALALAGRGDRRTCLVLLISGGASSMLALPAAGIRLEDKIATAKILLSSGAPIDEVNCVRKHLSAVKGGWVAARARHCCTLAISDVIGSQEDDPAVIGSGPGVPDPSSFADAMALLRRRDLWPALPEQVRSRIERGVRGELEDTPKPGDSRLAGAVSFVVGSRRDAMAAARHAAERLGYRPFVIDAPVTGEARDAAQAVWARAVRLGECAGSYCVISSGETTVTVRGRGRGGRNQELALAAVRNLGEAGRPVVLASVGTDGIDGPTDAAGALVDSSTEHRATACGLAVEDALCENDSFSFLDRLGDLVRFGPTGTNVGDLQVVLGLPTR